MFNWPNSLTPLTLSLLLHFYNQSTAYQMHRLESELHPCIVLNVALTLLFITLSLHKHLLGNLSNFPRHIPQWVVPCVPVG